MDETKGSNKFSNLEKLKNKFVLIIDSIYSGKTMIYTKKYWKILQTKLIFWEYFLKAIVWLIYVITLLSLIK